MKISDWVRKILYKLLPLSTYLLLLSRFYLVAFKLGLLKNNRAYAYPYFLKNIIKEGDVCIDIGANLGYLSTLFSRLVGKTGHVYSIEPIQTILTVLTKNTKHLKNVTIWPYALGEENKAIQLGNDSIHEKGFMASGRHSIIDQSDKVDITFEAEMRKGSELLKDLPNIDFIKCDIEGYEVIVLQEIEAIILKHRPVFLIEAGGENRKTLIQFFKEREFNCYMLEDERLIPATPQDSWDMLVIPNEQVETYKQFIA